MHRLGHQWDLASGLNSASFLWFDFGPVTHLSATQFWICRVQTEGLPERLTRQSCYGNQMKQHLSTTQHRANVSIFTAWKCLPRAMGCFYKNFPMSHGQNWILIPQPISQVSSCHLTHHPTVPATFDWTTENCKNGNPQPKTQPISDPPGIPTAQICYLFLPWQHSTEGRMLKVKFLTWRLWCLLPSELFFTHTGTFRIVTF